MLNFPGSPSLNQYYSYGVRTWQWNGSSWIIVDGAIDATTLSGQTADFYRDAGNLTGTYTGIVSGSVTTAQVVGLEEFIEDTVGVGFLQFGSGVAGTYDDGGNTYTISGKFASTTEHGVVRIDPSSALTIGTGILGINESSLTVDVSQITALQETVEDYIGQNYLYFANGISGNYNTAANDFTISGLAATYTTPGVATFNSADFTVTGGYVNIIDANISIASTQVSDFTEAVQDVVGNTTFLRSANGVTGVYDDTANTLTLSGINATATTKGVASFSSTYFSVSAGAVSISAVPLSVIEQNAGPYILGRADNALGAPIATTPAQMEINFTGLLDITGQSSRKVQNVIDFSTQAQTNWGNTGLYYYKTMCPISTASSNVLIHLPTPASAYGRMQIFKKISSDTNTVTISGNPLIDGDSQPFVLYKQWDAVTLFCDTGSWYVAAYHFE